jgi:hypothetical protein
MGTRKKAAIIQSNYIPWKGYFDIIHDVDIFVFLDTVRMTKRDWRTRNKIKTPEGWMWLTVPVTGGRDQLIYQVCIAGERWQRKHQKSLSFNYAKAPFFQDYGFLLGWLYTQCHENLSQFNMQTTSMICDILGIETELVCSMDLAARGSKTDLLINICRKVGATTYLSGPSARAYIDEKKFQDAGIELCYKDYDGYPEYPQLFPPFEHQVSILDLLFNCGPHAPYYIWGWRESVHDHQRTRFEEGAIYEIQKEI